MKRSKLVCFLMCFMLCMTMSLNGVFATEQPPGLVKAYILAGKGQVSKSAPFGVGSKIEDIKSKWGNPDADLFGIMIGYDKHNVMFIMMDTLTETMQDYATMIMPITNDVKGIPLSKLLQDLGDPTHKLEIDETTTIACYDTNGYHLQFYLHKDAETGQYIINDYLVSKEFMRL